MSTLDFVDQRKTYLLKGLRHFHMAAKTLFTNNGLCRNDVR